MQLYEVIAMELLATGVWYGAGVLGPDPFTAKMDEYDFPYGIKEM